jgi:hypothetical protein
LGVKHNVRIKDAATFEQTAKANAVKFVAAPVHDR